MLSLERLIAVIRIVSVPNSSLVHFSARQGGVLISSRQRGAKAWKRWVVLCRCFWLVVAGGVLGQTCVCADLLTWSTAASLHTGNTCVWLFIVQWVFLKIFKTDLKAMFFFCCWFLQEKRVQENKTVAAQVRVIALQQSICIVFFIDNCHSLSYNIWSCVCVCLFRYMSHHLLTPMPRLEMLSASVSFRQCTIDVSILSARFLPCRETSQMSTNWGKKWIPMCRTPHTFYCLCCNW